jgi:glycolate oxidase FAD binding subunit
VTGANDCSEALCEAVRRAHDDGEGLRIVGSGSKAFLTRGEEPSSGTRLLSTADHSGIVDYRPEELVLTARSGTSLASIERALAERGQHLPFEPPRFNGGGTLGGAVASGLSGPGRPWWGAVRDAVLGVELVNGLGERLAFGGQVMKNVAGYDVSRLQAGAFGTLGLLLAVSVKVLPAPPAELTLTFELEAREALARLRTWVRRPYPITGTCVADGLLRVRLSGAEPALTWAAAELGGEVSDDGGFWQALRDHRLPPLSAAGERTLWRCSLPPAAQWPLAGCLITWAGAERWWRPEPEQAAALPAALAAAGGHGRPFDGRFGLRSAAHVAPAEARYALRLRRAFDPHGVLNPALCPGEATTHAD